MNTMFPKKKKKPNKKSLIKKADTLFANIVKKDGVCKINGLDMIQCKGSLQCMHIISRKHKAIRWSFLNALAGCQAHHYWYTNNPWEWNELIKNFFPRKYKFVEEHRQDVWDKDLESVLAKLSQLEGGKI